MHQANPSGNVMALLVATSAATRVMLRRVTAASALLTLCVAMSVGSLCVAPTAADVAPSALAQTGELPVSPQSAAVQSSYTPIEADQPLTEPRADAVSASSVRDPVQEATLEFVHSFQRTGLGKTLRQNAVAWNVLAIAALFVLGFAVHLALQRALATLVTRALVRAHRERLAEAITASKLVAPLAAIAPLLLVARLLDVLGDAEVLNPIAAINAAPISIGT